MALQPWHIPVLYVAGGTLTVFLLFLWDPEEEGTPEEAQVPSLLLFIFWPIIWLVGAGWLIFNYPAGIKWLAERCRARIEGEDDQ
jgi:hypothetical protein